MSTQDSVAGYAYWISQDGANKIVYSLAVINEIDAVVNEGFRRIPHGGVESGGFLFGVRSGGEIRLEAFRPIECQHAFGPSFVLSERDLEGMRNQLRLSAADEELAGLRPLGWMLGHTRTPLQLSERELAWFDEFFPEPGSLTLLVKPERFQATRFVFLLRDAARQMPREGAGSDFILPLSGQGNGAAANRSGVNPPAPMPSLPAPQRPLAGPASATPNVSDEESAVPPHFVPPPPPRPSHPEVPKPSGGQVTRVRPPQDEPAIAPPPPSTGAAPTRPLSPFGSAPPPPGTSRAPVAAVAAATTSHGSTPPGDPKLAYPYASLASPARPRPQAKGSETFGLRSAAVLVLAALLGCVAGYWAYLQLPSPVIPVSVREQRGQYVVEWPSAQTNDVDYAALQVNDGQWVTLSPQQKTDGRAVIYPPPTGDLKIDLLAKHWLRDSRGIVRYIRSSH